MIVKTNQKTIPAKPAYLFLALTVALVMTGCASGEAPDVLPDAPAAEMRFEARGISRASVTTDLTAAPFVVYGDKKYQSASSTIKMMEHMPVTYSASEGKWLHEDTYHWYPSHEHTFVAIHPAGAVTTSDPSHLYSASQLTFSYTLPSSRADMADILVATHRRFYEDERKLVEVDDAGNGIYKNETSPVSFNFRHVMSLINVAARFSDDMAPGAYIQFLKLELSGFATKATFSVVPASRQSNSQTDDNVVEVSAQEGVAVAPLTIGFPSPARITSRGDYVNLFADNDAIIMLPQTFADDSDARFILSYTINDDPEVKQISLPLMGKTWESGKSYVYRFTLDRTGLHLDTTTITGWDVTDLGNTDLYE